VPNSVRAIRPSGFPLKTTVDGSTVPSVAIVTATVACFVLLVDVRMWTVFTPTTSSVFFRVMQK